MYKVQKAFEFGNNENGYYRKYADGTLECWGAGTITISSDIAWNGIFYSYTSINIKFAYVFIDDPVLLFDIKANEFIGIFVYNSNSIEISSIIAYSGAEYKNVTHKYSYHAIGRWK